MTEERSHHRDVEVLRDGVIAAASLYRDAMRRYMTEQTKAMARGVMLDELIQGNWPSFQEVARLEANLFALLDTLETVQADGMSEAPEGHDVQGRR